MPLKIGPKSYLVDPANALWLAVAWARGLECLFLGCKHEVINRCFSGKMRYMKSRSGDRQEPQIELFRIELVWLLDMEHPMVKLAQHINWDGFEKSFAAMWHDTHGRPAIDTRLMVALHYLKYTFDLSDEAVLEGWLQNPYWQYLSGMRYFEHQMPLDPSSMSRWRGRAGRAGVEELLEQSVRAGL